MLTDLDYTYLLSFGAKRSSFSLISFLISVCSGQINQYGPPK
jgi:hypothetical protein